MAEEKQRQVVSNISYKDITMENVKIAIYITEFYASRDPEGEVPAEPVTRLTPKFHDITMENVTATGSGVAASIVGLPESPVLGLTLKNVHRSEEHTSELQSLRHVV